MESRIAERVPYERHRSTLAPGTQFNEEPLRITLLRNIVLKAPLPPPRRHLSKNGWESLKPVIYELYIVRQQTARTVVEKLHANGYEATEKMVRDRLRGWGVDGKNNIANRKERPRPASRNLQPEICTDIAAPDSQPDDTITTRAAFVAYFERELVDSGEYSSSSREASIFRGEPAVTDPPRQSLNLPPEASTQHRFIVAASAWYDNHWESGLCASEIVHEVPARRAWGSWLSGFVTIGIRLHRGHDFASMKEELEKVKAVPSRQCTQDVDPFLLPDLLVARLLPWPATTSIEADAVNQHQRDIAGMFGDIWGHEHPATLSCTLPVTRPEDAGITTITASINRHFIAMLCSKPKLRGSGFLSHLHMRHAEALLTAGRFEESESVLMCAQDMKLAPAELIKVHAARAKAIRGKSEPRSQESYLCEYLEHLTMR